MANYRKSFLYYTDATWASEGQGFYEGKLGNFGQVAMGICMRLLHLTTLYIVSLTLLGMDVK